MNNKLILTVSILIICFGCTTERIYDSTATIYLINDSSVVVKSDDVLNYVIQPGETIIHKEANSLDGGRPTVKDYYLSFNKNNNVFIYDDDNLKCEREIYIVTNYENRLEISDLNFEFTFRFTDEKMANAVSCEELN